MTTIGMSNAISNESIILVGMDAPVHYVDRFDVSLPVGGFSTDYVTALLFTSMPNWAHALFSLRNRLGTLVGLKPGDLAMDTVIPRDVYYPVGDKAVFFTVSHRTDEEIVMAESDRHLDFRASVRCTRRRDSELSVAVTTVVSFNNVWGRLYFALIKPFHKMILKSLLRAVATRLRLRQPT
jgi:hypothetical protein